MKLKDILKELDHCIYYNENLVIRDVSREFDSYRGYYDHLAMARSEGREMSAVAFYNLLTNQIGRYYQGYKGGDYMMHEDTELFVANYGCCGEWVTGVGIDPDGKAYLITQKEDFNGLILC